MGPFVEVFYSINIGQSEAGGPTGPVSHEMAPPAAVMLAVVEVIPPSQANGYFYHESHAKIYDAMVTLMERQEPIDMALITDVLHRRGELQKIGGSAYLASLMESVVTSANALYHARLVRDKSLLRSVINLGSSLTAEGFEELELPEIVQGANQE